MKTLNRLGFLIAVALLPAACAQKGSAPATMQPPQDYVAAAPPATSPPQPQPQPAYVYEQKPVTGRPALVTSEQAQAIINRFKAAYPQLGSPRILIYVNRELVDEESGMKLVRRKERLESTHDLADTNGAAAVKSVERNTYEASGKAQPTLADRQTVRDVERLFGRPLRAAGATLVDQKVAAELIADKPIADFIGTTDTPQARKDREALARIADAVIEVLISSKSMTVPTISGSQNLKVPDIQATAINLKDSRILGQAASSDVLARVPPSTLGNFDVREVTEATALSLMDDMAPEQ
jgi:hypothetical protein